MSEKEKMLATSLFSFFHNIFYPLTDKTHHMSHTFVFTKKFLVLATLRKKPIGLTHSLIHHFETIPNSVKKLAMETKTEMWLLKDF